VGTDLATDRSLIEPGTPAPPPDSSPPVRIVAAVLVLALMPFPMVLWATWQLRVGYDYETVVFPVDLAFALLMASAAAMVGHSLVRRDGPAGTRLLAILTAVLTVAWTFHPSGRGAHLLLEMAGAVCLASVIWEQWHGAAGRMLAAAVVIVAAAETVWSGLQLLVGHALGLERLGEHSDPFLMVGSGRAPSGSLVHCYLLAALALIGGATAVAVALTDAHPRRWLAGAAVAVMPVAWTYSRAALLGLVLMLACLAFGAIRPSPVRARYRGALLTVAVAAGLAGAVCAPGWLNRASTTVHAGSVAAASTDRTWLDHEAEVLIGEHPITGVGPARYLTALKAHYRVEPNPEVGIFKSVHDLPLLAAAEGGLLAGAVMVALLLLLAWRSARAGPMALALYLAFLPYTLLDHIAWSYPQGVVLTGIWVGVLDALARREPIPAERCSPALSGTAPTPS